MFNKRRSELVRGCRVAMRNTRNPREPPDSVTVGIRGAARPQVHATPRRQGRSLRGEAEARHARETTAPGRPQPCRAQHRSHGPGCDRCLTDVLNVRSLSCSTAMPCRGQVLDGRCGRSDPRTSTSLDHIVSARRLAEEVQSRMIRSTHGWQDWRSCFVCELIASIRRQRSGPQC